LEWFAALRLVYYNYLIAVNAGAVATSISENLALMLPVTVAIFLIATIAQVGLFIRGSYPSVRPNLSFIMSPLNPLVHLWNRSSNAVWRKRCFPYFAKSKLYLSSLFSLSVSSPDVPNVPPFY
jgi:hypothetical protein